MTAKTILALLFLISVAVAGTVFARAISRDPPAAPVSQAVPATSTREVLVAAADLSAGALLRPRDVRWSMVPVEPGNSGTIGHSSAAGGSGKPNEEMPSEVLGSALRVDLASGAPIMRADLVRPGDQDFLRLLLPAGARAISITPAASGVLLNPGDRVDIILAQSFGNEVPIGRRLVGETVAEDIRLLAIEGTGRPDPSSQPRSVILEASPDQAQRIIVAGGLGKLVLTLRGDLPKDLSTPASPTETGGKPVWAGDVSSALADVVPVSGHQAEPPTIDVFHGVKTESVKPR